MRSIIFLILLSSFLFSKECYFNKVNDICYDKYFNKTNIYNLKADEEYYINKQGKIYTFDKTIEVKFNSVGAIFTILNDFELKFVDKIRKEVYLFNVDDRRELFPTISKLNKLKTVMKAQPHRKRRYRNSYIRAKQEAKKARHEAILEKAKKNQENKQNNNMKKEQVKVNGNDSGDIKKSFLKGNAH